jgi:hypothetical protein
VSSPTDASEREADSVARDIVEGSGFTSTSIATREHSEVARYSWDEFVDDVSGTAEAVGEAAEEVGGFARHLWSEAEAWATALSGVISFSGGKLTITVPPFHVCPVIPIQFTLPEIGKTFGPEIPLADFGPVLITGTVGLHIGLTPEISAQLGPCVLKDLRIVIDPLTPSFSASSTIEITTAIGLGGEVRAGLGGDVTAYIVWPDPPLVIPIPVAAISAGLSGFARGIIAEKVDIGSAMSYRGRVFHASLARHSDLGLVADLGLAGYGALELLRQNLCTLYWPLMERHEQMVVSTGFAADLLVDASGASVNLTMEPPEIDATPFDDLGVQIPRAVKADDCPICRALYALGLMPSQLGGPWPYHPTPPWSGPLTVYPWDPALAGRPLKSKAKCRGACGPDCDTCGPPRPKFVCEDLGGRHVIWVYPNYRECPSAGGCREHDACYDWAAELGERPPLGILGPLHRLCDFECICSHGAKPCVLWIFGQGGEDTMAFSDRPKPVGGCQGPCPEETTTGAGTRFRLCLPDIPLFDRVGFGESISRTTGRIDLHSIPVKVPYIGVVFINIFASGSARAGFDAGVGPAFLSGVCLNFDFTGGLYRGTAELHVLADIRGLINLTGLIGADANWLCLVKVATLEAGLSAEGNGKFAADLVNTASVSCRDGEIVLDNAIALKRCLSLSFDLDAFLRAKLFGFELFSETWNLVHHEGGRCWPIEFDVSSRPLAGGTLPTLGPHNLDTIGLLRSLLEDAADAQALSSVFPHDPAKASGTPNPCGEVEPEDKCGSTSLPLTRVEFFPGPRGQGKRVKASPLSKCAGNTTGSPPDKKIYKPQFDCIGAVGQGGLWVRAHILHGETSSSGPQNLHGPGDDMRNLIITDDHFSGLNTDMNRGAEQAALKRVYGPGNEVLWYDSRVDSYVPGLDFFAQSITVSFGSFDTSTGTEGPVILPPTTFGLKHTPPNCP